jgi:hypothetical protein
VTVHRQGNGGPQVVPAATDLRAKLSSSAATPAKPAAKPPAAPDLRAKLSVPAPQPAAPRPQPAAPPNPTPAQAKNPPPEVDEMAKAMAASTDTCESLDDF